MSLTGNIDHGRHQELKITPLKQKTEQKPLAEQAQDASATGLQWLVQAAASQQTSQQVVQISQDKSAVQLKPSNRQYEIKAPELEDIAILSTTTALKDESVAAVQPRGLSAFLRRGFNLAVLEESYRETFKRSKSHNLLLERFMSNVKFSTLKGLFSLLGLSAEEQTRIQKEVREKALAEIDARLENEWAYAKAMLEIVG